VFDTGLALCIVILVTLDTGPALCIDTSNKLWGFSCSPYV